jgi:hypothetical protein
LSDLPPVCNRQTVQKSYSKNNPRACSSKGPATARKFGSFACPSTTLQCVQLTDHVTLTFSNMSMPTLFLDIEKAFDTTWHPGLLYKLSNLQFSANIIKLTCLFLSSRIFRVLVGGKMSTPHEIQAEVPQDTSYSILCIVYV